LVTFGWLVHVGSLVVTHTRYWLVRWLRSVRLVPLVTRFTRCFGCYTFVRTRFTHTTGYTRHFVVPHRFIWYLRVWLRLRTFFPRSRLYVWSVHTFFVFVVRLLRCYVGYPLRLRWFHYVGWLISCALVGLRVLVGWLFARCTVGWLLLVVVQFCYLLLHTFVGSRLFTRLHVTHTLPRLRLPRLCTLVVYIRLPVRYILWLRCWFGLRLRLISRARGSVYGWFGYVATLHVWLTVTLHVLQFTVRLVGRLVGYGFTTHSLFPVSRLVTFWLYIYLRILLLRCYVWLRLFSTLVVTFTVVGCLFAVVCGYTVLVFTFGCFVCGSTVHTRWVRLIGSVWLFAFIHFVVVGYWLVYVCAFPHTFGSGFVFWLHLRLVRLPRLLVALHMVFTLLVRFGTTQYVYVWFTFVYTRWFTRCTFGSVCWDGYTRVVTLYFTVRFLFGWLVTFTFGLVPGLRCWLVRYTVLRFWFTRLLVAVGYLYGLVTLVHCTGLRWCGWFVWVTHTHTHSVYAVPHFVTLHTVVTRWLHISGLLHAHSVTTTHVVVYTHVGWLRCCSFGLIWYTAFTLLHTHTLVTFTHTHVSQFTFCYTRLLFYMVGWFTFTLLLPFGWFGYFTLHAVGCWFWLFYAQFRFTHTTHHTLHAFTVYTGLRLRFTHIRLRFSLFWLVYVGCWVGLFGWLLFVVTFYIFVCLHTFCVYILQLVVHTRLFVCCYVCCVYTRFTIPHVVVGSIRFTQLHFAVTFTPHVTLTRVCYVWLFYVVGCILVVTTFTFTFTVGYRFTRWFCWFLFLVTVGYILFGYLYVLRSCFGLRRPGLHTVYVTHVTRLLRWLDRFAHTTVLHWVWCCTVYTLVCFGCLFLQAFGWLGYGWLTTLHHTLFTFDVFRYVCCLLVGYVGWFYILRSLFTTTVGCARYGSRFTVVYIVTWLFVWLRTVVYGWLHARCCWFAFTHGWLFWLVTHILRLVYVYVTGWLRLFGWLFGLFWLRYVYVTLVTPTRLRLLFVWLVYTFGWFTLVVFTFPHTVTFCWLHMLVVGYLVTVLVVLLGCCCCWLRTFVWFVVCIVCLVTVWLHVGSVTLWLHTRCTLLVGRTLWLYVLLVVVVVTYLRLLYVGLLRCWFGLVYGCCFGYTFTFTVVTLRLVPGYRLRFTLLLYTVLLHCFILRYAHGLFTPVRFTFAVGLRFVLRWLRYLIYVCTVWLQFGSGWLRLRFAYHFVVTVTLYVGLLGLYFTLLPFTLHTLRFTFGCTYTRFGGYYIAFYGCVVLVYSLHWLGLVGSRCLVYTHFVITVWVYVTFTWLLLRYVTVGYTVYLWLCSFVTVGFVLVVFTFTFSSYTFGCWLRFT